MANKPGNVFYIVFVGIPLSAMLLYGIYIYYYHDYGTLVSPEFHKNDPSAASSSSSGMEHRMPHSNPSQTPNAKISSIVILPQTTLSVSEASDAHRLLQAELLIANEGASVIQLLYTPWPSSLVEPQIDYLGPDGKAKPSRIALPRDAIPLVPPHDPHAPKPIRFFLGRLNPGDKLSIPVSLNPPFDLSRPGKYSLHIQYDPSTFCRQMALNATALGIYSFPLKTPAIEFEVVDQKAPPLEKSSAAEASDKASVKP